MFRSSSFHTIDPKGRIIIPARFRNFIRADGGNGVMVSNMDSSLYAYTLNEWQNIEKKIISAKSQHMRQFKRFFLGNACECMCDKQERILIPQTLREYAGLEKDIVLVGVLDHFEIWSRDRWDKENRKMEKEMEKEEVKEAIASLGL
ncbi:MAG: division/cell wall cluster transcriptional repressor MraZ [Thermodesulfobacteriota bacterium]|nr:division/cell wall cluster transcriptional repressor MraZ [Thermodesulfobacteriota bacterium]